MDEFAFRKGCPYGTVLVDVEAGRAAPVFCALQDAAGDARILLRRHLDLVALSAIVPARPGAAKQWREPEDRLNTVMATDGEAFPGRTRLFLASVDQAGEDIRTPGLAATLDRIDAAIVELRADGGSFGLASAVGRPDGAEAEPKWYASRRRPWRSTASWAGTASSWRTRSGAARRSSLGCAAPAAPSSSRRRREADGGSPAS
ncbi:CATRA conflict system CASPASE/TPR repeat-associated protein [Streptomyces sp. NPDC001135]